jgi:hypothetical protein
MENIAISPEDMLLVLLPAEKIPHDATVSKRTGDQTHTLKHKLTVFALGPDDTPVRPPTVIDGYFIISDRGQINQVKEYTLMHWHVTAEEFQHLLVRSWDLDNEK